MLRSGREAIRVMPPRFLPHSNGIWLRHLETNLRKNCAPPPTRTLCAGSDDTLAEATRQEVREIAGVCAKLDRGERIVVRLKGLRRLQQHRPNKKKETTKKKLGKFCCPAGHNHSHPFVPPPYTTNSSHLASKDPRNIYRLARAQKAFQDTAVIHPPPPTPSMLCAVCDPQAPKIDFCVCHKGVFASNFSVWFFCFSFFVGVLGFRRSD